MFMSECKTANKLIDEKSPYLLQHAYNPVSWYPWGEEAFEKARKEDKPIFLSIGYSTCHWCHVMERESFEDEEVASALNDHFICIKVDREERPDIDQIYMSFCQATTGSGGWPLSVFITADKRPFYAGTYFPKKTQYGRIGFIDLLGAISVKWQEERETIEDSAERLTYAINKMSETEDKQTIDEQIFDKAFGYFKRSFDPRYGGFGNAPKFPTPHNLLFLLRYYQMKHQEDALKMVEKTLLHLYKGGIFDHIGFGFSRYSTDKKWLVPHFEKMLYDNALLLMAYVETYQITKNIIYKEIADKIITYIMRDMTSSEGGYYCAEDADSEGVEGKFYVWSKNEVIDILGEEDGHFYSLYYDISREGNFEGENIPNLIERNIEEINKNEEVKVRLQTLSDRLFEVREQRVHPYKDDKILTSWNGLMIGAMALAGRVFANNEYLDSAQKAISFIEEKLLNDEGRLMSRYRDGDVKNFGFLDDYAFLIWSYIELYEATFKPNYLSKAIQLTQDTLYYFEDEKNGGFYLYGSDSEQLIARPKEIYDGAIPSGNSVMANNLLKLSRLTGREDFQNTAQKLFEHFGKKLNETPMGYTMMLCANIFNANPTKEIVLAGNLYDATLQEMLRLINEKYMPFTVVLLNDEKSDIEQLNSFAKGQEAIDGKTTAYICENHTCQKPVTDIESFKAMLN